MPSFYPEGNVSLPTDNEIRSAAKWCQLLFDSVGYRPSPFPEGLAPKPTDDFERLLQKITILKGP